MNWTVTFDKFNSYYIAQSVIFTILSVLLFACYMSWCTDSDEHIRARKIISTISRTMFILHAILTPLYLLNPGK